LRLRNASRRDFTVPDYARAGHGVGLTVPNVPSSTHVPSRYGVLDLGGTPAADEAAREDSWPRLLRFLARL
jgi:hypothetical protein